MKDFLHHLFLPRESNNHRSKVLHHDFLLGLIIFLLAGQFLISLLKTNFPSVLGISIDVSVQNLLLLTNQKREESGLQSLQLNEELSKAALLKAQNMFDKDYWAHNAPTGTTPWVFIKKAGYEYVYAGENLARGFTVSKEVVNAWMNSPTHRDNMLSEKYSDVGFAVMEGKLLGEQTVLVVEIFGNKSGVITARQKIAKSTQSSKNVETLSEQVSLQKQPLFDSRWIFKNTALVLVSLFILVLLIDMIVVERKKIIRLVGHNLDHVFFLSVILLILFIISRGMIL